MSKPTAKLNAQQRLFVAAYLSNGFNAKAACIEAGYSSRSAYSMGPRLLTNPLVKAELDSKMAGTLASLGVTAERTLLELQRVAHADLGEAFDANGKLLPLAKMPADVRKALSGIDTEDTKDGAVLKVKLHDKLKALELLGKYQKLFVEQVETKDTTPKDPTPPLSNDERRELLKLQLAAEVKP